MSRKEQLSSNLNQFHKSIDGRANLLAVSKRFPASDVKLVYDLGQRDFGENKVQELKDKAIELKDLADIKWHFIGHLQTNKINQLLSVPNLVSIHSVDRMKLLNKLLSQDLDHKLDLFLQFNTSGEDEKSGFEDYQELLEAAKKVFDSSSYNLRGLMTMGKIRSDDFEKDAKACFSKLLGLKEKLEEDLNISKLELSMGMSSDFSHALEYKTSWIRIGTAIFGQRS